jgi:L-threonylcarbamoyladenylate synthase
METEIVSTEDNAWVSRAVEVIQSGGVAAFPTDTVYGIGADPFDSRSVARLYEVKGRPTAKAIPVLLGSRLDLGKVVKEFPDWVELLIENYWPGALTIVLEMQPSIPAIVSASGTVGVRIPDHPVALGLMQATGPLAVTSANRSGKKEASDPSTVLQELGGEIELVLDGGVTPGGQPSTVLDCTIQPPEILREGPISKTEVFETLTGS